MNLSRFQVKYAIIIACSDYIKALTWLLRLEFAPKKKKKVRKINS